VPVEAKEVRVALSTRDEAVANLQIKAALARGNTRRFQGVKASQGPAIRSVSRLFCHSRPGFDE